MIFISYSWQDKKYSNNLIRFLKSRKISYWVDSEKMNLSKQLEEQIINGISSADYYLKIKSQNANSSTWVNFEEMLAQKFIEKNNRIIIDKESLCITQCDHAIAYRLQQIH